jgi:hypothetical protein
MFTMSTIGTNTNRVIHRASRILTRTAMIAWNIHIRTILTFTIGTIMSELA